MPGDISGTQFNFEIGITMDLIALRVESQFELQYCA